MQVVGNLLSRFKHLEAPERTVRSAVVKAVKDLVGVDLNQNTIKINNSSVLYLNTNSSIKAAIFEEKQNILSRVNNILGKTQIKDIK